MSADPSTSQPPGAGKNLLLIFTNIHNILKPHSHLGLVRTSYFMNIYNVLKCHVESLLENFYKDLLGDGKINELSRASL